MTQNSATQSPTTPAHAEETARIQQMIDGLAGARPEVLPSAFWTMLNQRNTEQLESSGYDNFKQTVARNYYTWVVSPFKDKQTAALMKRLPKTTVSASVFRTLFSPRHPYFRQRRKSLYYNLLTMLLWEYATKVDSKHELAKLSEPAEGNPPGLHLRGKFITQDLSQSFLEYHAVSTHADLSGVKTVMELGAGYGRTAFVFLKLMPGLRYVIVDIPPALYICERYLSGQFSDRRIFRYRPFTDFSQVRDEMQQAELIFLLPNQLELLPDKYADMFINISSLHEMKPESIRFYFEQIDRLTSKYFYFKQWKKWTNPTDNITVREADYPVRSTWKQLMRRECEVQTRFFEAIYQI